MKATRAASQSPQENPAEEGEARDVQPPEHRGVGPQPEIDRVAEGEHPPFVEHHLPGHGKEGQDDDLRDHAQLEFGAKKGNRMKTTASDDGDQGSLSRFHETPPLLPEEPGGLDDQDDGHEQEGEDDGEPGNEKNSEGGKLPDEKGSDHRPDQASQSPRSR